MRRMAAIFGVLVLTACSNELKGDIQVTYKGQSWTVTPDECISGQRQGFFGVDARQSGKDDALVRVLNDPRTNFTLRLNVPGTGESILVEPGEGCQPFDLTVDRQNSSVNNVTNVQGHIRVTCDRPDLKIKADITFANCH